MRISLVTLGDPATLTGGYLYHRRMADSAAANDASLTFVSFPEWPFPSPALAGAAVSRRLVRQRPDVVVLDSIAVAFAAPWLWRYPRPLAAMVHQRPGGIDHGRPRTALQTIADMAAYRRCDRILVASETLVDELAGRGIRRESVAVVAPGRDLAPVEASSLDLRRGRRVGLLCVGNWVERKGITDLLRAFITLPEDLATLHLVGDHEVDSRYAARVRELLAHDDLAGRVVCHGPVASRRVAEMYAAADVFVLASTREPYGTVYGEAMAAGLPVVGWRAGNLPHLARHERDALIVEPGDIEGLAASLRRLCEDDELRNRLSVSAGARAGSFPTWEESGAAFFDELRSLVGSTTR
jgi:glycosyltransferase involved in cell wall biosynthesis